MQDAVPFRYIIGIVVIGLVIILFGSIMSTSQREITEISEETEGILEAEKVKIEAWIEENNLNQYGDPKDTVYAGGTPLFNEKTGKRIDRYEYILWRHPDKPWKVQVFEIKK